MNNLDWFPWSQYILDNVMYMDDIEVKRWLDKYKDYTMRRLSRSELASMREEDININLVDTKGNIYVADEDDELFEANQFIEDKPQEITAYFTGE